MTSNEHTPSSGITVPQAQQIIYNFLLGIVKDWAPDAVLEEFRHLFIHHDDSVSSETLPAIHIILFANQEQEFRNTIKRCCYILVNNWELSRNFNAIQELIQLFEDPLIHRRTLSPTLKRLRYWLQNFIASSDFEELQLFAARFSEEKTINRPGEWTSRYASYLLVPQYINQDNPLEQRQAAQALSRRLKDKFKFDLAMYTAHSQAQPSSQKTAHNPTALGDSVLRLIKAIVVKRGEFSYKNLARLFLEQVKDTSYASFKAGLTNYLLFSVNESPIAEQIQTRLNGKLDILYVDHDDEPLTRSLILRTSNRVIDYLMTENKRDPSPLFSLVLSQGNSLTLAIILLKIILISRNSNPYLEVRIADLIRYYENFPKSECQWVINFLEVFQVIFAIYADNIEYNLVKIENRLAQQQGDGSADLDSLDDFRIFSQMLYYPLQDNTLDLPQEDTEK
jgi:hypothetical protein